MPPPTGTRTTTGQARAPAPVRLREVVDDLVEAAGDEVAELHLDHRHEAVEGEPIAHPIAPDSMIGVLRTRALPNSSTKPSVTLKTPPYSAMSWPMSITVGFV
jgi:hypothetical protein